MSGEGKKIIIVRKKKGGHHEDHGGAWKVAYADFVTAMMAFFLVMWILGMDQGVKDMVEGYFSNPVGFKRAFSGGSNPLGQGSSPASMELTRAMLMTKEHQKTRFEETAEEISGKMADAGLPSETGADVELVITDQGLRIELMETGEGEVFFAKASSDLKPSLRSVLGMIAPELQALPNVVVVEGHTDSVPFGSEGYSNWELSVDRANAARRAMVAGGLDGNRIVEVRGHADRQPKNPEDTLDPRNRRISIFIPYREEVLTEQYTPIGDNLHSSAHLPEDHLPFPQEVTQ